MIQFCNFSLQNYPTQSSSHQITSRGRKELFSLLTITLSFESFGDLIVSTDHVKGKSLEVLAVKDPEVGAFVWRYGSTSVVAKIRTEKKNISRREIYKLP